MAKEIERKFLVTGEEWRKAEGRLYRQGYLSIEKERTVRVRTDEERGWLTIKGITTGATRDEYEYEIPLADAESMLQTLCLQPLIEKRRYRIDADGLTWEVDEFLGANAGLVVAEVELESEDQAFDMPPWIGAEVTGERRYYNATLVEKPFSQWDG